MVLNLWLRCCVPGVRGARVGWSGVRDYGFLFRVTGFEAQSRVTSLEVAPLWFHLLGDGCRLDLEDGHPVMQISVRQGVQNRDFISI